MSEESNEDKIQKDMKNLIRSLISTIRTSNQLPANKSEFLLCQTYESVKETNSKIFASVYNKMKKLINYAELNVDIPPIDMFLFKNSNTDELTESIIDANDTLIFRANKDLDQVFRNIPGKPNYQSSSSKEEPRSNNRNKYFDIMRNTLDIEKPQKKFKRIIPNTPEPYIPKLTHKPNAIIDSNADHSTVASMIKRKITAKIDHNHPYLYEIYMFQPPAFAENKNTPLPPKNLHVTPLSYIDTKPNLFKLAEKLSQVSEFGFDLESHSIRSYQGFTCLIQISTRDEDFIIDTITLHDDIHVLNNVFTNPNIIKIGHGTDHDIIWLQRDFDIFVVNLFDTQKACKALSHSQLSLGSCVNKYFKVSLNKAYQLADWRERPLSQPMLDYARSDSHFLIPLYEHLVAEMHMTTGNHSMVKSVFESCKHLCMKLYSKPVFDKTQFVYMKKTWSESDASKNHCFLQLCKWRDDTARIFDESTQRVISNNKLLWICNNINQDIDFIVSKTKTFLHYDLHDSLDAFRQVITQTQAFDTPLEWDEPESQPPPPDIQQTNTIEISPIQSKESKIDHIFSSDNTTSNVASHPEIKKFANFISNYEGFALYKSSIASLPCHTESHENITTASVVNTVIGEQSRKKSPGITDITADMQIDISVEKSIKRDKKRNRLQSKQPPPTIKQDHMLNQNDSSFNYSSFDSTTFTSKTSSTQNPFQKRNKSALKKKRKY